MQESEFTGCMNKVQGKAGIGAKYSPRMWPGEAAIIHHCGCIVDTCGYVDPFRCFLYDELLGRLAQRLERSVYTRKVVRSNRTVPTIVAGTAGVTSTVDSLNLSFVLTTKCGRVRAQQSASALNFVLHQLARVLRVARRTRSR